MATIDAIRTNVLARLLSASEELSDSEDGDTNEYVMRRYEEFERWMKQLKLLDDLAASETETPGPYEIITRGEK